MNRTRVSKNESVFEADVMDGWMDRTALPKIPMIVVPIFDPNLSYAVLLNWL